VQLVDETARSASTGTPRTSAGVCDAARAGGEDDLVLVVLLGRGLRRPGGEVQPRRRITTADWGAMLNALRGGRSS
jgi:hypothetical protein